MLDRTAPVARIVLDHSECAPVFQKHRIDYCCRGDVGLDVACRDRGLDTAAVLDELETAIASRRGEGDPDFRALGTPAVIGHIITRHHEYLRRALPFLVPLAQKVARVHGANEPDLREVEAIVVELAGALIPHLDQEEQVLFPALMARSADRARIDAELKAMHDDHLAVGNLLHRMRTAANEFRPPSWACNSYRTLLAELEALEADVLRHVHLENHVLMPRFVARVRGGPPSSTPDWLAPIK